MLNGGFEDVNTCTEYRAECGVEGWFYLQDVKAQMLLNEENTQLLGINSFGIFSNWNGYTGFTPLIGTPLPCGLQAGKGYTFRGIISAKLGATLDLRPGICTGAFYYVPRRPFSATLQPDSIRELQKIPATDFFRFSYHFTASGNERYLTFGMYVFPDTTANRKKPAGVQTVSLVLDNFALVPDDPEETPCPGYGLNKALIYEYDYRHREMDHSLYGKGELDIALETEPGTYLTRKQAPPPPPITDTLKLGDVLFDFNKAGLKAAALSILNRRFQPGGEAGTIDSIYVEGHTDSVGSDQRNLELSRQRCISVQQWLVFNNVTESSRILIRPFGKSRPIAGNRTAEGRAQNRRVELIIFRHREKK